MLELWFVGAAIGATAAGVDLFPKSATDIASGNKDAEERMAIASDESWRAIVERPVAAFLTEDAWTPVKKTCISCGSKTQPCCGH